jgi:hypothetical protein
LLDNIKVKRVVLPTSYQINRKLNQTLMGSPEDERPKIRFDAQLCLSFNYFGNELIDISAADANYGSGVDGN